MESNLSAKQHIEALFKRKAKCDDNSTTLANTLQKDIETGFKGQQKYIYELLQNADDASVENQELTVRLTFIESTVENDAGYLIFSHSGQHFTPADVEKITDNAQQFNAEKGLNSNKTGYKGIGFKAIFSVADYVCIKSNEYCFRFEKNYEQWKNTNSKTQSYPWPIIPIWTSENKIPQSVSHLIQKTEVNFIIRLKKNVSMQQEIESLLDKPEMILFLRNLRCLELKYNEQTWRVQLQQFKQLNGIVIEKLSIISKQDIHEAYWMKHVVEMAITSDNSAVLEKMSDYECPTRLKRAKTTQLIFACQLDKNYKIIPLKNSHLFAYLPTQVNTSLPYLINADFLLNPARSELLNNVWNDTLFSYISYYQFKWFAQLATISLFKSQVLHLLVTPSTFSSSTIQHKNAYSEGYKKGINEIAFIPNYTGKKLLLANQAKLDKTEFYLTFKEFIADEYIVYHPMEKLDALKEQALNIDLSYLCKNIILNLVNENKTIPFQSKLYSYLSKITSTKNIDILSQTEFVLTIDNKIVTPKAIYFSIQDQIFPKGLTVHVLHPDLEAKNEYVNWLTQLGARRAVVQEVIKGPIFDAIVSQQVNKENVISITQFIFSAYINHELSVKDFTVLKRLPILTKGKQLISAETAYLSKSYQPELNLQNSITEDIFVSSLYQKGKYAKNFISQWKAFFISMGVTDEVKIFIRNTYKVDHALRDKGDKILEYINLCTSSKTSSKINPSTLNSGEIYNFLDSNILPAIGSRNFSKHFWPQVIKNWDLIRKLKNKCIVIENSTFQLNTTYLAFLINSTACIACDTSNKLYFPFQVLSPTPRFQILAQYIPVADLGVGVELTHEQAEYFEFKTQLKFKDILTLLQRLTQASYPDIKAYEVVLSELIKLPLTSRDLKELRKNDIFLPVQNGTLQPISKICSFAIDDEMAPANSSLWLRELPSLTRSELIKLSTYFNITIIKKDDITFETEPSFSMPDAMLTNVLDGKLPYIARVEAHTTGNEEEDILDQLAVMLEQLKIYNVKRLFYTYKKQEILQLYAVLKDNNLFFKKSWNSVMTIASVIQALSKYFKLSTKTQNLLTEILVLSYDDLNIWFGEKGFSIKNFPKRSKQKHKEVHLGKVNLEMSVADSPSLEPTQQSSVAKKQEIISSTQLLITSPMRSLKPVAEINVNQVKLQPAKFPLENTNRLPTTTLINNTYENDVNKKNIGSWGEEIVYKKLRKHYCDKYPHFLLMEKTDGFAMSINNEFLWVIWHNKNGESGKNCDFTINKNGIERYIEVKSTASDMQDEIHLSANEYELMCAAKERYRFFRVYNSGQANPRIEKIKNPADKIEKGQLSLSIASYIVKKI